MHRRGIRNRDEAWALRRSTAIECETAIGSRTLHITAQPADSLYRRFTGGVPTSRRARVAIERVTVFLNGGSGQ